VWVSLPRIALGDDDDNDTGSGDHGGGLQMIPPRRHPAPFHGGSVIDLDMDREYTLGHIPVFVPSGGIVPLSASLATFRGTDDLFQADGARHIIVCPPRPELGDDPVATFVVFEDDGDTRTDTPEYTCTRVRLECQVDTSAQVDGVSISFRATTEGKFNVPYSRIVWHVPRVAPWDTATAVGDGIAPARQDECGHSAIDLSGYMAWAQTLN
jgi:hypothetical protein